MTNPVSKGVLHSSYIKPQNQDLQINEEKVRSVRPKHDRTPVPLVWKSDPRCDQSH